MYFLKYLYPSKIPLNVYKSILIRQQLLIEKTDNSLKLRFKTFLSILFLLYKIPSRAKKTQAEYLIIDSFIAPKHINLRKEFIAFFNKNIELENIVLTNHHYFFYRTLSFKTLLQCIGIWFKFLVLSFFNLFINEKYPTSSYYYVAANLINAKLMQPKGIYLFQLYDPSTYLSALLLQKEYKNIYASVSNSFMYGYNRYTVLEKVNIILCHKYQYEEVDNFTRIGWFSVKSVTLWGPEEILQHNAVPVQTPTFDVGMYSSGYWARKGRLRERDVEAVRSYKHIENPHHVEFMNLLESVIFLKKEFGFTVKIYTHPSERDWFNDYDIKPPYWDLAIENDIEIDLSDGNSLDKLYEVKIGLGGISTILLDRWHHGLMSLILYKEEEDSDIYHPSFLGNYSHYFFNNLTELKPLIDKHL